MSTAMREHILTVAADLFSRQGFRATGVDAIITKADVAKKTLYTHFKSKDALIAAVLKMREAKWFEWMTAEMKERAWEPRGQLLAMFDALHAQITSGKFRGCLFSCAAAEFPSGSPAIRAAIKDDVTRTYDLVRDLCLKAGAPDPDGLARELAILRRGAMATALMTGEAQPFLDAKEAADRLLEAAGIPAQPTYTH